MEWSYSDTYVSCGWNIFRVKDPRSHVKKLQKKNQQLQTKPVKNVRLETEKKPCIFGRFYCDEQHLAFIIREK